jgi:AcrR family transcriptional regulator
MAEKGLPRVTAREVATRANLNAGLVRYYFGGKEGLLRAVIAQIMREGQERRDRWESAAGDPRERLRGLITSMIENFWADPYAPRLITEQVLFGDDDVVDAFVDDFGQSHVEALERILEDGRRSGVLREVDPELAIPAITGAAIFFFLASPVFQRVFDGAPLTSERVERFADTVATLVLDGIGRRGREVGA